MLFCFRTACGKVKKVGGGSFVYVKKNTCCCEWDGDRKQIINEHATSINSIKQ
jgi:hypothetical protein